MDVRIVEIKKEYEKLKERLPNIISMNEFVLNFHIKKMNETLNECENALNKLKNLDVDITKEQLMSVYIIRNIMYRHIQ